MLRYGGGDGGGGGGGISSLRLMTCSGTKCAPFLLSGSRLTAVQNVHHCFSETHDLTRVLYTLYFQEYALYTSSQ